MKHLKHSIGKDYQITTNTLPELLEMVEDSWEGKRSLRIVTFNPEMLVTCEKDFQFKEAVKSAQIVIPDGIGLVLLLKKLGVSSVKRQPGIELAWESLKLAIKEQLSVVFIGSTDEVLQLSISNVQEKLGRPNLIYSHNGFFDEKEEEKIINLLIELQPSLLLVAMPFVRQEKMLHKAFQKGLKSVALGVGGSFDVWAGKVKRAPQIFQRLGVEWLWRVLGQPERIKRIIQTAIPFIQFYFKAK